MNKTLTSPAGKEVVLATTITAGQRNQLRKIAYKSIGFSAKVNGTDSEGKAKIGTEINSIDVDQIEEREKALIGIVLKSYDGKTDNLIDLLINADPSEYDFVVKEAESTIGKFLSGF